MDLHAIESESDTKLSIHGQIRAEGHPIDAQRLLYSSSGPIPIRFADHYLPLLGLPKIPVGSTLADVTKILGQPNHRGGGFHAVFKIIPQWIRYTLSNCYLRLQLENDIIIHEAKVKHLVSTSFVACLQLGSVMGSFSDSPSSLQQL